MKADQTPDEINTDKEWAYFQECLQQDPLREMDDAAIETGRKGIVRKILVTTAIAASVLLIIGVGYNWLGRKESGTVPVTATVEKNSPATVVKRHEVNTTDKTKRFV